MGFFDSYHEENIKPQIVAKEGVYLCKIGEVTQGTTEDGTRYVRIDCVINSEGYPHTSIFLTEGAGFNGKATAFYDTFGIPRGSQNPAKWKDKRGYLEIRFKMKDGYKNMIPYFILDEHGWVKKPQKQAPAQSQQPSFTGPTSGTSQNTDEFGDMGDIPF